MTDHPEHFSFDSDALPAGERFQHYREMNAGGAEAKEAGPHFRARVDRWRLDRAILHDRELNDVIHELDDGHGNAANFDHFTVTLIRSGRFDVDTGGGFVPIPPGSIYVIDMTRPMRSWARNAHTTTFSLARELTLATGADERLLHGLVLDRRRGALLADFMVSLVARVDDLPGDAIVSITQAFASLLAVGLDLQVAEDPDAEIGIEDMARLQRVRRLIEQRLVDPLFGPDVAIGQSGLSRATVYRLFKPHGGLSAYIQKRRLDRVRVALSDVTNGRALPEIVQACGFLSESHCSRLFRSAFGVRPGHYRAELIKARDAGLPEERLHYWHPELR
jgi:AraC-like DNA-binding protein